MIGDAKREPFKKKLHPKPLGNKGQVAPAPLKTKEQNKTKP